MEKGYEVPAGQYVALSFGCYSDYRVKQFAKLLKALNESAWNEMIAASTTPPAYNPKVNPRFHEDAAIEWLRSNGYIEEIEYVELSLGDYGNASSWADA